MIREAKEKDFNTLLKVFREVQNLHATNEPNIFKFTDPIKPDEFKEMVKNPNIKIFVSVDENIVNGFLIGSVIERESNLTLSRKQFVIENLAVLKSKHNKSIGKSLINKAKEFAEVQKCDSLILSVWCFNSNALGFYKHLGFEEKSIKMELNL